MSDKQQSPIFIGDFDYQRLTTLIDADPSDPYVEELDAELSRAEIVAQAEIPEDSACMDSQVTFEDIDSGEQKTVTLVFPRNADISQARISVFSPVGSALLGLRIGGTIDWPLDKGKVRRLKVISVIQPQSQEPHQQR